MIETSIISVQNGKFDLVADVKNIRIDPNAFDTIYRCYGEHIYPGFIAPNTKLGLTEIDAVRATHDYQETGEIKPHVRSLTAYNTDSKIIKTVRTNGILLAQSTPRGGWVSGQSSVFYLDGWNWEDAICRQDDGIHLSWPTSFNKSGSWDNQKKSKKEKNRYESVEKIKIFLKNANAYFQNNDELDIQYEATRGIFNGTKTLYIHANYSKDIIESIQTCLKIGVKKIVLVGGRDVLSTIEFLKKRNIPVILNRIHSLPYNEDSPLDQSFTLPAQLHNHGILFCLAYNGDMEAMGTRNLPFTAGTSVAYGLKYEDAVKIITLNPAKILGLDQKCGSIETGKDATFFISSGDALDIKNNDVKKAYIKGEMVNLQNHQTDLFQKFKNH